MELLFKSGILTVRFSPDKFETTELKIYSIICEVARVAHISTSRLICRTRTREISEWRHLIAYICRRNGLGSLHTIGQNIGGRDHSTVINSIKYVEDFLYIKERVFMIKYNLVKHLLK